MITLIMYHFISALQNLAKWAKSIHNQNTNSLFDKNDLRLNSQVVCESKQNHP